MNDSNARRVVITGYGALTDLAPTAQGTWDAMRDGRSGVRATDLPDFHNFEGWTVTIAGQVLGWEPDFLDSRDTKRVDRCTLLGMGAAEQAVRHSGLDFNTGDPTTRGIVVGSGIGGIKTIEDGVVVLHSKGPARLSPFTVPRLMVNAVTGNISIRYNLQGPASTHATACASSGHAIGDAMNYIRRGQAEVMLAGGAEAAVTPLCIGAFMAMRALSCRNDQPEKASRPFDAHRDGFVLAEGAAMYVLESEEHARARGANILGELVGFGNSSDAGHITAPDPEGRGATSAMRWALRDAQLNTTDIDYINAHGTSTPLGDKAEVHAVKALFNDRAAPGNGLVMSSTKSVHGHTLGASGAVELIACLHAINEGIVPPTINLDTVDPDCAGIDLVPHTARQMPVRYAMNNTFGFGGHNVTLIAGAYDG